jgi:hypothetical protein
MLALRRLHAAPSARLEVALCGMATERLLRYGEERALQMLAERASAGQVSFSTTACGGALLPLLAPEEARRQLALNEEINREALGDAVFRAESLFPPQLGYSRSVAELALSRGLTRVLADALAYRGGRVELPRNRHFTLQGHLGFDVFFVDRGLSVAVDIGQIRTLPALREAIGPPHRAGYAVVRIPARLLFPDSPALRLLGSLDGTGPVIPASLEELRALFGEVEQVEPLACALGTDPGELAAGVQFAKWSAPDNELHAALWRLAQVASSEAERLRREERPPSEAGGRLRALLDLALDSQAWRYASGKPELDPARVREGGMRLLAAIRAGRPAVSAHVLAEAERVFAALARRCEELSDAAATGRSPPAGP